MFSAGPNTYHQLHGEANNKSVDRYECPCICPPQEINIDIDNVISYSIGADHSVYITKEGRAYASGFDEYFRIGTSSRKNYRTAIEIKFPGVGYKFESVHCGSLYTLYMYDCGLLVYCHEKCKNRTPAYHVLDQKPVYISGGVNSALAIDTDGCLYEFSDKDPYEKPKKTTFKEPIFDACGGFNFVAAITVSGKVYGNGAINNDQEEFVEVPSLIGLKFVSIKADHYHCIALTDQGDVYAFGDNGWGQLGNGTLMNSPYFVGVETLKPHKIAKIAVGHSHTIYITTEGEMLACGYNGFGQLMQPTLGDQKTTVPTKCMIEGRITYGWCGTWATTVLVDKKPPVHGGYDYFFGEKGKNSEKAKKEELIRQLIEENEALKEENRALKEEKQVVSRSVEIDTEEDDPLLQYGSIGRLALNQAAELLKDVRSLRKQSDVLKQKRNEQKGNKA